MNAEDRDRLLREAYELLSWRSSVDVDEGEYTESYPDDEVCAWLDRYRAAMAKAAGAAQGEP